MYKIHDVTLDCVAFCVSGPGRSWPPYLMMLFAIILAFEKYCVLLFACLFNLKRCGLYHLFAEVLRDLLCVTDGFRVQESW